MANVLINLKMIPLLKHVLIIKKVETKLYCVSKDLFAVTFRQSAVYIKMVKLNSS